MRRVNMTAFDKVMLSSMRDPNQILQSNSSDANLEILMRESETFANDKKQRNYFNNNPKTQNNFNKNQGRSYACVYSSSNSFIQRDVLGQLDSAFYHLAEKVYEDCVKMDPDLEEDASKIFTFMGCSPEPIVAPPPSSKLTRTEIDLPEEPSTDFLNFLDNFLKIIINKCYHINQGTPFKIASKGNPGFPDFVKLKDVLISKYESPYLEGVFRQFKKTQILFQNDFFSSSEFLDALLSGDVFKLFRKFEMIFLYTDQHRGQPDRFNKDRKGYDIRLWLDRHRSSLQDYFVTQDKKNPLKKYFGEYEHLFKSYAGFEISARKNRLVFAMSSSTNTCVNLVLSHFRKNYGEDFEFTYKNSDTKSFNDHIDRYINTHSINTSNKDIFSLDISNYDNSISPQMNSVYCGAFRRKNEVLGTIMMLNSCAPGIMNGPYMGQDPRSRRNKKIMIGNPFDLDTFAFTISPSGVCDVTERAKLICTAFILHCYSIASRKVLSEDEIISVLTGRNPKFAFFNLGDNNFIIADKSLQILEFINKSDVFKVDISDAGIFGGLQFKVDHNSNSVYAIDSATSVLIKILAPERPLDDPMRSSYELGYLDKYEKAKTNKLIADILECIDKHMYNLFRSPSQKLICSKRLESGNVFSNKSEIYEHLQKYISMFGPDNISSAFREVVDSGGDKLFYTELYDSCSQKEKKILDEMFFSVIEPEDCCNIIHTLGM